MQNSELPVKRVQHRIPGSAFFRNYAWLHPVSLLPLSSGCSLAIELEIFAFTVGSSS